MKKVYFNNIHQKLNKLIDEKKLDIKYISTLPNINNELLCEIFAKINLVHGQFKTFSNQENKFVVPPLNESEFFNKLYHDICHLMHSIAAWKTKIVIHDVVNSSNIQLFKQLVSFTDSAVFIIQNPRRYYRILLKEFDSVSVSTDEIRTMIEVTWDTLAQKLDFIKQNSPQIKIYILDIDEFLSNPAILLLRLINRLFQNANYTLVQVENWLNEAGLPKLLQKNKDISNAIFEKPTIEIKQVIEKAYAIYNELISSEDYLSIVDRISIPYTKMKVSKIGFGCLQFSSPEPILQKKTNKLVARAVRRGVNFFVTGASYGNERQNEILLGNAHSIYDKNNIVIATKCGIDFSAMRFCQSEEEIRDSVQKSIESLQVDKVDLLLIHRIDPDATPVTFEKTIAVMKNLVISGKAKAIGLSEPTAEQIIHTHQTEPSNVPISVVESAYSIATRRAEYNGVLAICRKLNIIFVAYTSLIRGLTDQRLQKVTMEMCDSLSEKLLQDMVLECLSYPKDYEEFKRNIGLFSLENIKNNIKNILRFQQIAQRLNCTPAQLSIAWLLHQNVIPIPGTSNVEHLLENIDTLSRTIPKQELNDLSEAFPPGCFTGYPNPSSLSLFDNDLQLEKKI